MSFFQPITALTLQHVLDWAIAVGKSDYTSPVNRCSGFFGNLPLSQIPADLAAFKRRYPLTGFDPRHFPTEKAYKAWRRKVIAAIKGCSGQLDEERARRARQDLWADLIAAMCDFVGKPGEGKRPEQILIPIRKLADLARQHGTMPYQVSQDWLADLRHTLGGNEWTTLQTALKTLNTYREEPTVRPLLPAAKFGAPTVRRQSELAGIPEHISSEIREWVAVATRGKFDKVEGRFVGGNSDDDVAFKTAALRNFVSTLSECMKIHDTHGLRDLLTEDCATLVVRRWTANCGGQGSISARTANDYTRAIRTVMARNGMSPEALKQHLANNQFLNGGKDQDKEMSPKVRRFCETLVGSEDLIMTFLSLHVRLRNKAQRMIDDVRELGRELTAEEVAKIRSIGTVAMICAIETRGAPIRIENALQLKIRGDHIDFHLPNRMTDQATIVLPAKDIKNNNEIWAPIKRGNLNGLEVVEWYLDTIRPLYPNAETSEFLFPTIRAEGSLGYGTFLNWFKRETRAAGLPMTPHNFRHGLASLLIMANPGRWDLIERLLDDTVGTAKRNYGWVNERTQRAEVQKYILDLSGLKA